ncbi:MAG: carboxypeptidase regulatory-like domain-containing protein, partial [Myxococcaceae bacterium]
MRKWPIIIVALLLLGGGVAFLLPRPGPSEQSHDTAATQPVSLPEFHEIAVTGGQTQSPLALTGRVMDQGGKPVANAKVSLSASAQQDLSTARCDICERPLLSCENGESFLKVAALLHQSRGLAKGALTTTTDADGKFRFDQLAGVSFTVFAEAEGFGAALHERAAPGDPVELFLPPPRAVSGVVRDDFGKPVPLAHVHAVSRRLPINAQVNVNADGSFE